MRPDQVQPPAGSLRIDFDGAVSSEKIGRKDQRLWALRFSQTDGRLQDQDVCVAEFAQLLCARATAGEPEPDPWS